MRRIKIMIETFIELLKMGEIYNGFVNVDL